MPAAYTASLPRHPEQTSAGGRWGSGQGSFSLVGWQTSSAVCGGCLDGAAQVSMQSVVLAASFWEALLFNLQYLYFSSNVVMLHSLLLVFSMVIIWISCGWFESDSYLPSLFFCRNNIFKMLKWFFFFDVNFCSYLFFIPYPGSHNNSHANCDQALGWLLQHLLC